MIQRDKLIDIFEVERSLPLLLEYLQKGEEPPISTRTFVLLDRGYLQEWRGLFKGGSPQRLTLEGGTILLRKWFDETKSKSIPE